MRYFVPLASVTFGGESIISLRIASFMQMAGCGRAFGGASNAEQWPILKGILSGERYEATSGYFHFIPHFSLNFEQEASYNVPPFTHN